MNENMQPFNIRDIPVVSMFSTAILRIELPCFSTVKIQFDFSERYPISLKVV